MRQSMIILTVAAIAMSPMAFAQSTPGGDARPSTADAGISPGDRAPASKAHRAMASFDSLLREAALQSQAKQRAPTATPTVAPPAPPAHDREALADTPVADPVR